MSLLLLGNKKNKDIVKNGLVMYLNGVDFRNSPPSTYIYDNCNTIRYNYTNMFSNGNFALDSDSDGIADGFSVYNSNMIGKLVYNNEQVYTPTAQWGGIQTKYQATNGDIIYVGAKIRTDNDVNKSMQFAINRAPWSGANVSLNKNYSLFSFTYTSTGLNDSIVFQDQATSGWVKTYIKEFCIYNLTQIFGAGNEPNVSWCDANLGFIVSSSSVYKGNIMTSVGFAYNTSSGSDNNKGIKLDGVDDYFQIPSNFLGTSITNITLEAKIKMSSFNASTSMGIIDNWTYPSSGFCLRYYQGQIHFVITNGSTYIACSLAISNDYNVAHIVGTYDGSVIRIYKNGTLIVTNTYVGAVIPVNPQIRVGKCNTNVGYTNGTVYCTRIYNRALNSSEVIQNYKASK
ncbi:MAG: LamG domain-containing protein [Bacillota bacterium]|nr:LamG domain-containing protein [Bacillota bacterium]